MNRYEREASARLVDGYFSPSPSKRVGIADEFHRAKQEGIANLRQRLTCVESLTYAEFMAATKRKIPP